MEETTIFKELADCIHDTLKKQKSLTLPNISLFLLGEAVTKPQETLSTSFAYKIYKGERSLSSKQLALLITRNYTNWDISNLKQFSPKLDIDTHISQLTNSTFPPTKVTITLDSSNQTIL